MVFAYMEYLGVLRDSLAVYVPGPGTSDFTKAEPLAACCVNPSIPLC